MFADDIALLATDHIQLNKLIKRLKSYLNLNKLKLNLEKSKVIIFAKKLHKNHTSQILWRQDNIEIVNTWKYLGIKLNRLAKIDDNVKNIKLSINNKQYALIKYLANKNLNNLRIHTKLFNALIKSTFIYAALAWMWKKHETLESIQTQYYKRLFLLQINSPAYLIYTELGIRPTKVNLIQVTFNFWMKLAKNKKNSICLERTKILVKTPEK